MERLRRQDFNLCRGLSVVRLISFRNIPRIFILRDLNSSKLSLNSLVNKKSINTQVNQLIAWKIDPVSWTVNLTNDVSVSIDIFIIHGPVISPYNVVEFH